MIKHICALFVALNLISFSDATTKYVKCLDPYELYQTCGPTCDPNCEIQIVRPAIKPCVAGCFCKPGYVRHNKKCILPANCPKCNGTNEVYKLCSCDATCTKPNITSSSPCSEGCFCKPGYVRFNGNCILVSRCPPQCTTNEVLNVCPAQCSFADDCRSLFNPVAIACLPLIPPPPCIPRCECKPGYVLLNGTCVPVDQCCSNPITEQIANCSTSFDINCQGAKVYHNCTNFKCICRSGYVRSSTGNCILQSTCPPTCAANEVLNMCPAQCSVEVDCQSLLNPVTVACSPVIPPPPCNPRCECKAGYVLLNGTCVPEDQCCSNPVTEHVVSCSEPCDENCLGVVPSSCNCVNFRCACRSGYVRNAAGVCIIRSSCPPICSANEVLNMCPGQCSVEDDCQSLLNPVTVACSPVIPPPPCNPRCECIAGYVLLNGTCVPEDQCCSNPVTEHVVSCSEPCDENCLGVVPSSCNCVNFRCACRSGYVRNAAGVCIIRSSCPPICSANEVLNMCPDQCSVEVDCQSLLNPVTVACSPVIPPPPCNPRCECKAGYVLLNGICVPKDQCCFNPVTEHEVSCSEPCDENCLGVVPSSCVCVNFRCACRSGYVRNAAGICIIRSSCPPICSANEVLNMCPGQCSVEDDCQSLLNPVTVACSPVIPPPPCNPRCECIAGYVLSNGTCVPEDQCCSNPVTEHVVSCSEPCDENCLGVVPSSCNCVNFRCACRSGYVRNAAGVCIIRSSCPPICSANEVLNMCPGQCSVEDDCQSLLNPVTVACSPVIPPPPCNPRCECIAGYVLLNGTCVPEDQCCSNPVTEHVVSCSEPCDENCLGVVPSSCNCVNFRCACRSGYVRNAAGVCIIRSSCPPICSANEVLNMCPAQCSVEDDCQSLLNPVTVACSPLIPPPPCNPRCECIAGYVLLNGTCVPEDQCCSNPVTEHIVNCSAPSDETCQNLTQTNFNCTTFKCACKNGYVRNSAGICIIRSNCPVICSNPNEVYMSCGTCDRTCDIPNKVCNLPCQEKCFCKPGYLRNMAGTCVLPSRCPTYGN
ncbi:zonadhesin-like [Arctopsyche grandis]|uniref:zonadhesin-like n=1 Tax=Arctopsyche grandis TaxID=121162 RepID=UPI00406D7402